MHRPQRRVWVRARLANARKALDARHFGERFTAGCAAAVQFGEQALHMADIEAVLKASAWRRVLHRGRREPGPGHCFCGGV